MKKPNGHRSVMASRIEPPDSLDYFPTPPWAVRAFCVNALSLKRGYTRSMHELSAWDPACGEGHLLHGLRDSFGEVHGSDVYDYRKGFPVGDFLDEGLGHYWEPPAVDWIITNPPFNLAADFVRKALTLRPRGGVAMIMRTAWLETASRYRDVFSGDLRPSEVWISADRIPMVKGRYDPDASSATSYAWFLWDTDGYGAQYDCALNWIPPGGRSRFFHETDVTIGGGQ